MPLAACSGDDDDEAAPSTTTDAPSEPDDTTPETEAPTTTTTAPPPTVALQLVESRAVSPYGDATVDPTVQQAILDVVTAYVQRANAEPLYHAQPATGLDDLFSPAALARATGPDAATVLDVGPAPATGGVELSLANCTVTVLAGLMGVPQLATADLHVVLEATSDDGVLRVERYGALTLVPGDDGAWHIDGFHLTVDRRGPGVATTTTTAAADAGAPGATDAAGEPSGAPPAGGGG